jgi:hypothetical protein
MAGSPKNQRVHSRRSVRLAARVSRGKDSVEGTVENLGEGGAFFATRNLEIDLDEGEKATITFTLPGAAEPTVRTGTVLRDELYFDGDAVVRSFALQFDELLSLGGVEFA